MMTQAAENIPRHVAIIMDGNRRWAKQRHLPALVGHERGGDNIRPVVELFARREVEFLTLYAFSTENWGRPKVEVAGLLRLLAWRIDGEIQAFHKANVRLVHIGRLDRLSRGLRQKVEKAVELTHDNTGLTLVLAFDYGGRDEIVTAVRKLLSSGAEASQVDEQLFADHLFTRGIPDPDLVIRTGGEQRLSNFLLWQSAYSELYFTPALWPDFGEAEVEKALLDYGQRQRRFGKV